MNNIKSISVGEGNPVILVHGIAASLADWDLLSTQFHGLGYRIIAADLPGHGASVKPHALQEYNTPNFYSIFKQWLESLKLGSPPILIGHSIGAYFILMYALEDLHNARALVLIDPYLSLQQFTPLMKLFYRPAVFTPLVLRCIAMLPQWVFQLSIDITNLFFLLIHGPQSAFTRNICKRMANDYKSANPGIFLLPFSLTSLESELSKLDIPVLVIGGTHDQNLRPDSFEELAANIPGAKVHLMTGNHNPHHSNPDEFSRVLFDFIQKLN